MYPVYNYMGVKQICEEVPVAFPPQTQTRQPGIESMMDPRPISENPCDRGDGRLRDRSAVITGGDSGIGRAIAYAFAREGADVAIVYLNEHDDALETKRHVESLGRRCLTISCDLRREESSHAAVSKVLACFGKLDCVVNNHAVQFVHKSILDITEEQLDLIFRTNLYAYFFMVKAALPFLRHGAAIINTASATAYRGCAELLDYSASKGAVISMTRSLALNLIDRGIRVNAVAPGPVWTPMQPASRSPEAIETFGTSGMSRCEMQRAGQPFEIAPAYVFLASDDSSFMTGQVLHPNGGIIV